ncbi:STAS/SEC14 domain-containing protein [Maritimibacter dapengensis]|uniref:STAS/SEC14 domain-containing protein n=1 Tax=Maritimibacter dapengensis TaxID=2836868 RepID=A0ABS6T5C6_9RHOB|nr:STAS/SEC14 domain-containing protein [Maritimibacter dapengensis]MBV7380425.1 STAS/SEC14 domain-containing protein [Maritimibacter dapengensis]
MIHTEMLGNTMILTLHGTVERDDIAPLKDTFASAFNDTPEMSIIVDMTAWTDITDDAIGEDLGLELKLLGKLGRIDRIALVSNKEWVGAMVDFVGPWLPGTKVCRFGADDMDAAQSWCMQKTAA